MIKKYSFARPGVILLLPILFGVPESLPGAEGPFLSAGLSLGLPLAPEPFRSNWSAAPGLFLEYRAPLGRRWGAGVSAEYLDFGLDGRGLAEETNAAVPSVWPYSFHRGHFRAGFVEAFLTAALTDPDYPVLAFARAGAGIAFLHQEDLIIRMDRPGQAVETRENLGGSGPSACGSAGLGLRVRAGRSLSWWVSADAICALSGDRSGSGDLVVLGLTRATGDASWFAALRTGFEMGW